MLLLLLLLLLCIHKHAPVILVLPTAWHAVIMVIVVLALVLASLAPSLLLETVLTRWHERDPAGGFWCTRGSSAGCSTRRVGGIGLHLQVHCRIERVLVANLELIRHLNNLLESSILHLYRLIEKGTACYIL